MASSRATPEPAPPLGAVESVPFTSAQLEGTVFARFERIAERFPDRDAVREPRGGTSYARLLDDAMRLGAALEARLAGAPGPVALVLDAGSTLFAGMLGALRAGRPYAAVDPRLPDARVEAMLRSLEPAAVIADEDGLPRARRLLPDAALVLTASQLFADAAGARSSGVSPGTEDPACVVFTSGSTSAPRGVVQSHRNVLHNVARLSRGVGISPSDRISLLSSPSFGASVSDVFGALLNGAAVCPYSLAGDGLRRLPAWLEREGITILHCVPSVFRSLAWTLDGGQDLSRVRMIKLGGEAVLAADLDLFRNRFPARAVFHVGYGASEINVMRQWFAGHDTPWPGASPLGHAVDGVEVVLLDESGRETDGEGEIGIVSDTLALGYWHDPERTSATFLPVPGRPGVRLYRTGDLGRLLPDGCLLHLGRRDERLKVRGHRVETAEVEGELLALAGVREAAVDAREHEGGVRLVAWIAREDASVGRSPLDAAAVRRALAARLPSAMVPAHVVFLPALPRTPGGKVDRRALPDPRPDALAASTVPSAGGDAARIAEVFGRVLGGPAAVADGDFFELGGDSLSAVELLVEIERELGVELTVADLLEGATPSALAARASSARARGGESERQRGGMVRLSAGDGVPVVVVPGGGGDGEDLFVARRLARLAGGAHPFFSLRSGRPPHPPLDRLAESCVERIRAERPRGPYVLVGDCVGGVLAVAIAERLRGAGEFVAPPILVDAPFPGAARRARSGMLRHAAWLGALGRRAAYLAARLRHHAAVARRLRGDRLGYLRRQISVAARGLTPRASAREREARARRDSWVAALMGSAPPRFEGTLRLIETEEGARRGFGRAWSAAARGVEIVRVAGAHTRLILDHGEEVAAALRRWLAEARLPPQG